MTNILGSKKVVVDSDALIGLIHEDDSLHKRCVDISRFLSSNNFVTVVPYPIVLEAATTLSKDKAIRRPDLASKLLKDYALLQNGNIKSENVGGLVAELYSPKTSKKNSPFDYYVLALAELNDISLVFSFDSFYKKQGLKFIEDLM